MFGLQKKKKIAVAIDVSASCALPRVIEKSILHAENVSLMHGNKIDIMVFDCTGVLRQVNKVKTEDIRNVVDELMRTVAGMGSDDLMMLEYVRRHRYDGVYVVSDFEFGRVSVVLKRKRVSFHSEKLPIIKLHV